MALSVCPECGKPVSTSAQNCPSCGYPIRPTPPPAPAPKKEGMPWYVGCLIAFAVFFVVVPVLGLLAAIAIPSFVKARDTSQMNVCANNLRQVEAAKDVIAVDGQLQPGDPVDGASIAQALGAEPRCPAGGAYAYGTIGTPSSCSKHGQAPPSRQPPVEKETY